MVEADRTAESYVAGHGLLDGRTAVVTAAAGAGIGGATARRFLEEGARVVIGDVHARRTKETVGRLAEEFGAGRVHGTSCDVTDEAQVAALFDLAEQCHGGLDIVVNNAGLGGTALLTDMTDEQWGTVVDTTLTGTFRCTRAALRRLRADGRGGIVVNNASVLGWRAQAGQAHYAAAKAGVMALTRCAAVEAAPHGIRVNAIAPSLALHPHLAQVTSDELLDDLTAGCPRSGATRAFRQRGERACQASRRRADPSDTPWGPGDGENIGVPKQKQSSDTSAAQTTRAKKKPPVTPSAERRGELLGIAADVFAEQGYNATTVRKIADAAGMLAGSLYYHFDSKESMLEEILRTFLTELWDGYDSVLSAPLGPRETLEALVTESFREIDRHRSAVAIYQKESKHLVTQTRFEYLVESQQRFEKAWLSTLERGVAEGAFRADLDVRLAYRFVRDTVWVAASWYRPGGGHSPEEIARQYLSMVLDGIAVRT